MAQGLWQWRAHLAVEAVVHNGGGGWGHRGRSRGGDGHRGDGDRHGGRGGLGQGAHVSDFLNPGGVGGGRGGGVGGSYGLCVHCVCVVWGGKCLCEGV